MSDDHPVTVAIRPVVSYTTAVTQGSVCVLELTVAVPGKSADDATLVVQRFGLGREDAAALGRALLESAALAKGLAAATPGGGHRH